MGIRVWGLGLGLYGFRGSGIRVLCACVVSARGSCVCVRFLRGVRESLPRCPSSTLLPFLKSNSRKKGTLIIKGLLGNLVAGMGLMILMLQV